MTSSMENRPSDSVVWACRLPFSADIGELPAAGPETADGACGRATARAVRSVTPSAPEGGGASLVLVLSRAQSRRQGRGRVGRRCLSCSGKEFPQYAEFSSCIWALYQQNGKFHGRDVGRSNKIWRSGRASA